MINYILVIPIALFMVMKQEFVKLRSIVDFQLTLIKHDLEGRE